MELNDSVDLIKFINKETKKKEDLNLTLSYKIFCRSLPKIITNLYKNTYSVSNINLIDVIVSGCDIFHNIYWFILRYTNNCDVALFLSETSINLFTESLNNASQPLFKMAPNISESVRFAYKKTIGPLPSNFNNTSEIDNPQLASLIIKMFTVQIMKQLILDGTIPSNHKYNDSPDIDIKTVPARLGILLDYIQQNNKTVMHDIWHVIYYIINKNSESITDKLYYQINHYINNYSFSEEKVEIENNNKLNWLHNKKIRVQNLYKNIYSLIEIIKDFSDSLQNY